VLQLSKQEGLARARKRARGELIVWALDCGPVLTTHMRRPSPRYRSSVSDTILRIDLPISNVCSVIIVYAIR